MWETTEKNMCDQRLIEKAEGKLQEVLLLRARLVA